MRQCPDRYAIRAGQNLPDKEFRYLRTVIVTAAVYWGFNSELSLLLLTFQHRAGVSPYTSSFDFAETCVFAKQSLGPILCGHANAWHPFSLSYGVILPSSLTTLLPSALGFSPHLPVSVYGTGTYNTIAVFLGSMDSGTSLLKFRSASHFIIAWRICLLGLTLCLPGDFPFPGFPILLRHYSSDYKRYWNFNQLSIDYDSRPRLRSRLTQGRSALPWKP